MSIKLAFTARLIGLGLIVVTMVGCAQNPTGQSVSVSPAANSRDQAVLPATQGAEAPLVIERSSIADPKVGDICDYEVEQGVRRERATQRVVQVTKGYSYLVQHTGIKADGLSLRYRVDGNPWSGEVMSYREQFRYPIAISSGPWQILERTGGRPSDPYLENNLTVRVTEVGQAVVPGVSRLVRVVGLAITGHYSMHDPGGNGVYGTGRIEIDIRYAPDLHCLVSQRLHKTRWDGSPYIHETVRLVGYRQTE